jgi:hypothetical protein
MRSDDLGDAPFILEEAIWEGVRPGVNGSEIIMVFDRPFPEDRGSITYDHRNGYQLYVNRVTSEGYAICKIISFDVNTFLPLEVLEKAVPWYLINNKLGEYSY